MPHSLKRSLTDPHDGEHWRRLIYSHIERRQIRIFELSPACDVDADPECTMYIAALETATFAAISYVWGDPSHKKPICLNGHRIRIGANAQAALRYIRDVKHTLHVWMDCLCINQCDLQERNQQVALMGNIFQTATAVFVWTGEPTINEDLALTWISAVSEDAVPRQNLKSRPGSLQLGYWMLSHLGPLAMRGLCMFFNRDVWYRVWVVQEILLSDDRLAAVLVSGKACMPYHSFLRVLYLIHEIWVDPLFMKVMKDHRDWDIAFDVLHLSHKIVQRHEECTPAVLVYNMNRSLHAKDPRDRIYGFLGLIAASGSTPDYSKSVEKVYEDATSLFLQSESNLRLLLLRRSKRFSKMAGSPSWAVDWASPYPAVYRGLEQYAVWNACAGSAVVIRQNRRHLLLSSCKLFVFHQQSSLGPDLNDDGDNQWQLFTRCYQFAKSQCSGADVVSRGEDRTAILWRTMVWDNIPPGGFKHSITTRSDRLATRAAAGEFARSSVLANLKSRLDDDSKFSSEQDQHFAAALLLRASTGCRLAVSPSGRLCMTPDTTIQGDSVHILAGAEIPVVLRPRGFDKGCPIYELVGPAYVHGMMDGEAVADSPKRVSTGDPDAYDSAFEMIRLA